MTPTELYLRLVFGDASAEQVMARASRTVHDLCRFTQPLYRYRASKIRIYSMHGSGIEGIRIGSGTFELSIPGQFEKDLARYICEQNPNLNYHEVLEDLLNSQGATTQAFGEVMYRRSFRGRVAAAWRLLKEIGRR